MQELFSGIYKNKKVLITGHTGFKGAWLTKWLIMLGAEVIGYSLEPETKPSLYEILNLKTQMTSIYGDIRDKETLEKVFQNYNPEIVFHLAAQPLVRLSYQEPLKTYETNVIGTLNVLEAARKCGSIKAFINVTSDKCYENKETVTAYKEGDYLGGHDMYSSSKACSEILTSSYRKSFLNENTFALASARAGNVIGGGDWAQDRLIPDCVKSILEKTSIKLRNPYAIRPWQHVLEPLSGYLLLGQKFFKSPEKYSQSYNFGPSDNGVLSVKEISEKFIHYFGGGTIEIENNNTLHEAKLLMLDITKATEELCFKPVFNNEETIKETANWYLNFYKNNTNIIEYTEHQIYNYINKAKTSELIWSLGPKCSV